MEIFVYILKFLSYENLYFLKIEQNVFSNKVSILNQLCYKFEIFENFI